MESLFSDIIREAQTPVISILIWASLVDIIVGILKACYQWNFSSVTSVAGITKHITIVVVPIIIHPLFNIVSGGDIYFQSIVAILILTMASSILGNYASMGLPYPKALNSVIDTEKYKQDPVSTTTVEVPAEVKPEQKPADTQTTDNTQKQ